MKINWKGILFWSNQFYGICAVLMAMESSMYLLNKLPSYPILLLIHLLTVIYYTHAYIMEQKEGHPNERTVWYIKNKKFIYSSQVVFTLCCLYLSIVPCKLIELLSTAPISILIILSITILFCSLYYIPHFIYKKNIRKLGIIKSISIAWVWTVACCIIPIWMMGGYNLIATSFIFWIHFAQLFLFILILAILFDIKDIERDQDDAVSTIVIRIGKNKLINSIITPILIVYGFAVTLEWKMANLSFTFLGMQMILLVLVYIVSKKVISIYSIFKNILLIDGLMIIKAILSIIVIKW